MHRDQLLPLHLRLRSPDQALPDPLFRVSTQRIPKALGRARIRHDRYRCRYCGFTAARYQVTVQTGASPRVLDDLATCCRPCWQVMNLEGAVVQRSAELVWLPELAQAELNLHLPRLYSARISQGAAAMLARSLLEVLKGRHAEAERRSGFTSLDALVKALRLAEGEVQSPVSASSAAETAPRTEGCAAEQPNAETIQAHFDAGLRILPLDRVQVREAELEFNMFPQMLAFFRSRNGPLSGAADGFAPLGQDWLIRLGARVEPPPS